ncbi:hypothetical protein [Halostagnicola sp. A-GB9-2]|uniref:ABC transporter substrate-binding protein n=1 Tax=Halostagnicola sp. A-GB9-2 TaxID=3048066 RepID=UPI0024BFA511|nr:hypothetical protein [Halostagnicola sp. A-GB9-2]MDJ1433076.1 hypothetical protein [Halostagnicola sp. A-GB9-2]
MSSGGEDHEIPLFLHAAGDIKIVSHDSNYTFRTGLPPSPAFIRGQEGLVEDRGFDTLGAITADYAWGVASNDAIQDTFPDAEIEVDTIFAEPIQYTDWGELDQFSLIWSGFELEAPDYYPDGDFDLHEEHRTEPMDAVDPDDWT